MRVFSFRISKERERKQDSHTLNFIKFYYLFSKFQYSKKSSSLKWIRIFSSSSFSLYIERQFQDWVSLSSLNWANFFFLSLFSLLRLLFIFSLESGRNTIQPNLKLFGCIFPKYPGQVLLKTFHSFHLSDFKFVRACVFVFTKKKRFKLRNILQQCVLYFVMINIENHINGVNDAQRFYIVISNNQIENVSISTQMVNKLLRLALERSAICCSCLLSNPRIEGVFILCLFKVYWIGDWSLMLHK